MIGGMCSEVKVHLKPLPGLPGQDFNEEVPFDPVRFCEISCVGIFTPSLWSQVPNESSSDLVQRTVR